MNLIIEMFTGKSFDKKITTLFLAILILLFKTSFAQETTKPGWDNQIYFSNKIAGGKNKIRYSGEIQVRLRNNFQSLDNWFVEGTATYLANKWLEIVPDLRFTVKPDKIEIRPGIGILLKKFVVNWQFINQVKWQTDFASKGNTTHAFREVVFVNYRHLNEKIINTLVAGFIYKMTPDRNYTQYIRVGPGVSYIFDKKHILNFSYFVGVENRLLNETDTRGSWLWSGIPMLQLVINITKRYTYQPAYYFNF